ncbi:MAG TPA: M1 family metallopeptidase [Puia sp.]|nr:M1 family metallopeptidase [Puia sp.]
MRYLAVIAICLITFGGWSQNIGSGASTLPWQKIYRSTATKYNDLVHTRLDARFDFSKAWMYGTEWLTAHPHFYSTDSLILDAKGITLREISILHEGHRVPLKFTYDSNILRIGLDRIYAAAESYVIYIDYISKPDERKLEANSIVGAKGLYFINPTGADKKKSTQVWTQGESEFNSAWLPTIDKPNQKCTEEINMTVPAIYKTISNGLLVHQISNSDGTRTDSWKMDLPNAPYLFFMGVGDYAVIKDNYKGKEVSYYVEKPFASVARRIFGLTPEMIWFFSSITGVDFPWPKYAQVVGRDNESFSMENTSATLHGDFIEQDARELADGNNSEDIIAHELFHQWFGDYVTCESWSNVTLNESFADYGETLWHEHMYGKDDADAYNYLEMNNFLSNADDSTKSLVRFKYADKDDVFDAVSYAKGGRILHMLRNYVGDKAFFKSLELYLKTHKFSNGEAHDLRLAFEEVTGQDLNWFWNQWYYSPGHPRLDITYRYDASTKMVQVYLKQEQAAQIFTMPVAIDVYAGGRKMQYRRWFLNEEDTFYLPAEVKPDLVNFDAEKVLLCEKNDHKSLDEFVFQYKNAGLYVDRIEALTFALKHQNDKKALLLIRNCLYDPNWRIRLAALNGLNTKNDTVNIALNPDILNLSKGEKNKKVKAQAIEILGNSRDPAYQQLITAAISDSSYNVSGKALFALAKIDSSAAMSMAKKLYSSPAKGELKFAIIANSDESRFDAIYKDFASLAFGNEQFYSIRPFAHFLGNLKNTELLKKGVDLLVKIREDIPSSFRGFTDPEINGALKTLEQNKRTRDLGEQAEYIASKIPADKN